MTVKKLVPVLDRVGAITKRPPIWAVVAGALVWRGGQRNRDAALRGGVAYAIAAVLANMVMKPLVHRRRPAGSGQARIGPLTSSFPSGHAATDLAFVFGVSQRSPALFAPLAACTIAAHWSLVRSRAHHVSDILVGGALGIAVAVVVGALWPGQESSGPEEDNDDPAVMTRIEGEDARLLVHIERLDEAQPDTSLGEPAVAPRPPDPAGLGQ
jgi:membrane-associated phospholipid phosphatase